MNRITTALLFLFLVNVYAVSGEIACYEMAGITGKLLKFHFIGSFSFIPRTMFLRYRQTDIHKRPDAMLQIEEIYKLVKVDKQCGDVDRFDFYKLATNPRGYTCSNNRVLIEIVGSDGVKIGKSLHSLKKVKFGESAHPTSDFELHDLSLVVVEENTNFADIQQASLRFITTNTVVLQCEAGKGHAYIIEKLLGNQTLESETCAIDSPQTADHPSSLRPLKENEKSACKSKEQKTTK
ncbi:hypothetical protein RF11_07516 [Thelohanellus kitauei]|uniref:Uncharacterized protein n=1 Tax=Thelohanellus kitauei TaxID=669202 RepID=A0A0C2MBA4_THEKT|nr:hypothetical protein RF11_07516 [Thelohanellus kitauei]